MALQSRTRASCHSYDLQEALLSQELLLQSRPRASCHSYVASRFKAAGDGSCNPALGLPAIPTPMPSLFSILILRLQSRPRASCHSYPTLQPNNQHLHYCCNPALGLPAIPT